MVVRTNLTDTEESNVNEAGGYVLRDSIPVKYETGEPHLSCDESGGAAVLGRVRIGTRRGLRGLLGHAGCSMP